MKCFQLDLFLDDLNLKLNKTSFEDFSVLVLVFSSTFS